MQSNKTLWAVWAGRIMTGLAVLFLAFDGILHIVHPSSIDATFIQLGYNPDISVTLGIIMIVSLVLYMIPRTSMVGALLITGYLGGAVASHVRVDNPLFGYVLFPVYVAILLWGGAYFMNEKVRAVFGVFNFKKQP